MLLAVVLLGCGGLGLLGIGESSDSKTKASKTSTSAAAQPANEQPGAPISAAPAPAEKPRKGVAPAGSAVRDGQFEFVVTKIERGQTFLQDGYSKATAQGEFVLVSVKVTNTGKQQRTFWGDEQILIDDQDREFTASGDGARAIPNNNDGYSQDLNPGFSLDRVVVFDIPPGTNYVTIEFHDSPFSGGVKVALQ
ncbi:DUF4352 domain-containing protein [Nocardia sp. NPDC005978]|uniref:DUF4352 domain-containing protein n=1 Tax=Nocardia sp. NPDC005978 TaxID=3156725 RepID=UPI0033B455B8